MWKHKRTDDYISKVAWYAKKGWEREVLAAHDNLDTYFKSLKCGANPLQLVQQYSFVRNEGQGVYAIDQSGGGKNLRPVRLYVYPILVEEILGLITFGEKSTQGADIALCREFTRSWHGKQKDK